MNRIVNNLVQIVFWSLIVYSTALSPRNLHAQQPGDSPDLPIAADLTKVPTGSWADYAVTMPGVPPVRARVLLVSRDAKSAVLEMSTGMSQGGRNILVSIVQWTYDLSTKPGKIADTVLQIAGQEPQRPPKAEIGKTMIVPNPKDAVGSYALDLKVGKFTGIRYADPAGTRKYWTSDKAPPVGIIRYEQKMTASPVAGVGAGVIILELIAMGAGGKPSMTKQMEPPATSSEHK